VNINKNPPNQYRVDPATIQKCLQKKPDVCVADDFNKPGTIYNIEVEGWTKQGVYSHPEGTYRITDRKSLGEHIHFYGARRVLDPRRFGVYRFLVNPIVRRFVRVCKVATRRHTNMLEYIMATTGVPVSRYYISLSGLFIPATILHQFKPPLLQLQCKYDKQLTIPETIEICRHYYVMYGKRPSQLFEETATRVAAAAAADVVENEYGPDRGAVRMVQPPSSEDSF